MGAGLISEGAYNQNRKSASQQAMAVLIKRYVTINEFD